MAKRASTGSALLPHRSVDHCRTFYSNYHHRPNELLIRVRKNQLWAGMAKETAHQLGTPVSSLKGWVEVLREIAGTKNNQRN